MRWQGSTGTRSRPAYLSAAVTHVTSPSVPPALPARHLSVTTSGLATVGRAFSYGYDLASMVPANTAGSGAQASLQVAGSLSGGVVAVPIMGWGLGNPEISPGVYNFSQIARQVAFVQAAGGTPVITLCAAPDWMKGGLAGTTDWTQINVAPVPQHYQDFATLGASVAAAFPQVKYFVVWNELKGFWSQSTHSWDMAGYTAMYNDVYTAIKAARPDASVGGPYVSMQSSAAGAVQPGTPSGSWGHLDAGAMNAVTYWLSHKIGADFVAVDGRGFTSDQGLITDPLTATQKYAAVDTWLASQTTLPVFWMESHALPNPAAYSLTQQAAIRIAIVLQMASSGASAGLQWNAVEDPSWDEGLWISPLYPGGGQTTPLARELPAVLAVLASPVTLVPGQPAGTLVATGAGGTVTVTVSATSATVSVNGRQL